MVSRGSSLPRAPWPSAAEVPGPWDLYEEAIALRSAWLMATHARPGAQKSEAEESHGSRRRASRSRVPPMLLLKAYLQVRLHSRGRTAV